MFGSVIAEPREEFFVTVFAFSENNKLGIAVIENVLDNAGNEVDALLVGKTRYHGDKRLFFADGKPQFLLQCRFVLDLIRRLFGRIAEWDRQILGRIVVGIVDAV